MEVYNTEEVNVRKCLAHSLRYSDQDSNLNSTVACPSQKESLSVGVVTNNNGTVHQFYECSKSTYLLCSWPLMLTRVEYRPPHSPPPRWLLPTLIAAGQMVEIDRAHEIGLASVCVARPIPTGSEGYALLLPLRGYHIITSLHLVGRKLCDFVPACVPSFHAFRPFDIPF